MYRLITFGAVAVLGEAQTSDCGRLLSTLFKQPTENRAQYNRFFEDFKLCKDAKNRSAADICPAECASVSHIAATFFSNPDIRHCALHFLPEEDATHAAALAEHIFSVESADCMNLGKLFSGLLPLLNKAPGSLCPSVVADEMDNLIDYLMLEQSCGVHYLFSKIQNGSAAFERSIGEGKPYTPEDACPTCPAVFDNVQKMLRSIAYKFTDAEKADSSVCYNTLSIDTPAVLSEAFPLVNAFMCRTDAAPQSVHV